MTCDHITVVYSMAPQSLQDAAYVLSKALRAAPLWALSRQSSFHDILLL